MTMLNGHGTMLNGKGDNEDEENTTVFSSTPTEELSSNPFKKELILPVRIIVNAYNALNYISKMQNSTHFHMKFCLLVLENKKILQKIVQWADLQALPANQKELVEYEAKKIAIARRYSQSSDTTLDNNGQIFINSENRAAFEAEIAPLNKDTDYEAMLVKHSTNVEKLMSEILAVQFYGIPTELLPEVGIPITALEHIIFMLT